MKKLFAGLFVSFLCATTASAYNQIPLKSGTVVLDAPAVISLASLNPSYVYNIDCKITDPEAAQYPVIFKFDVTGLALGFNTSVHFDGNALATSQAQISDNHEHHVTVSGANFSDPLIKPSLQITLLTEDANIPVEYDCSASYAVGK